VQVRLQIGRLHGRLRVFGGVPSLGVALWGIPRSVAALAAIAVLAAGCGGGASGEGDPATVVPPDAIVYTEMVVRPEGSLRDDALDAAGKVLRTENPEAEIRSLVDRALEGEEVDYARDVEPWLGERAAGWLPASGRDEDPGVILLAATDTDEARTSLEAALERGGGTIVERSHRGHDYLVDDDEVAVGVVDDFVVIGRETNYKRTIDAAEGDSLAAVDEYADAIGSLEDDRLAHFWVDTPAVLERAGAMDELSGVIPLDDLPPIAGSFAADGERLAVEAELRGSGGSLLAGGSTPLLQELPGDSWAAFGSADVGESLREAIDGFAGAIGALAVRREVRDETGLDLDRDLLDWIGHVGVFVRGTTPETLGGGVVIQPTDEGKAAGAFGKIVGAAQVKAKVRAEPIDVAGADQAFELRDAHSPRPVVIARGSGLVIVTAGRAAAEAALGSDDRLGDTDLYAEAQDLVGMEPSALFSMPALLELVDDYEFREAKPYLEAYSVVSAGVVADGDEVVGRVAAGLK
jgi:hypothetical protein